MQRVLKAIQIIIGITSQTVEYLEIEIDETKCCLTSIEQEDNNFARLTEKIIFSSEKIRMRRKSLKFDIKMI